LGRGTCYKVVNQSAIDANALSREVVLHLQTGNPG
jgi:hypothetical protein